MQAEAKKMPVKVVLLTITGKSYGITMHFSVSDHVKPGLTFHFDYYASFDIIIWTIQLLSFAIVFRNKQYLIPKQEKVSIYLILNITIA